LLKLAINDSTAQGHYSKTTLTLAGMSGLVTTTLGIALVFFPAQQISSLWSYELWMFGGTLFFVGLAAFLFYVYGRRKAQTQAIALGMGVSPVRPSGVRQ
jgi:hypothetical protein